MKNLIVALLTASLLGLSLAPVARASDLPANEAITVEEIRANVKKLGTGKNVQIEVKLKDDSKVKGYISEAGDEDFSVVEKSGITTAVPYTAVRQVFRRKRILGLVIAIAIISIPIIILAIENGRCKRGSGPCS